MVIGHETYQYAFQLRLLCDILAPLKKVNEASNSIMRSPSLWSSIIRAIDLLHLYLHARNSDHRHTLRAIMALLSLEWFNENISDIQTYLKNVKNTQWKMVEDIQVESNILTHIHVWMHHLYKKCIYRGAHRKWKMCLFKMLQEYPRTTVWENSDAFLWLILMHLGFL